MKKGYVEKLRQDLIGLVGKKLNPVSKRYAYSDTDLEVHIKWRPLVLVLGNYSSGKSTLINELVGCDVQRTGQAPTDDSFTVLTYGESDREDTGIVGEHEGSHLFANEEYPFSSLKKYGQRLSSHFAIKKLNSPFLKDLAIIDTPGMLDSLAERDRGYDYQAVIGELASMADLVILMFDPHKAGTIRETHESLRKTLPAKTFEDRVVFVLNRVDECGSMMDLLRVYGTLCWNLSQMTGRKDIPHIYLTYSPECQSESSKVQSYLEEITSHRDKLKDAIFAAPRFRLEHLMSYVEHHGGRLEMLTSALMNYKHGKFMTSLKWCFYGVFAAVAVALGLVGYFYYQGSFPNRTLDWLMGPKQWGLVGVGAGSAYLLWLILSVPLARMKFHRRAMLSIDSYIKIQNQTEQDTWDHMKQMVLDFLSKTNGSFSGMKVRRDHRHVKGAIKKTTKDLRKAVSQLQNG